MTICNTRNGISQENKLASTLILGFPASKTVKNTCLLFQLPSPWYYVTVAHANKDRKTVWVSGSGYEKSVLSNQLCCEPTTTSKNKVSPGWCGSVDWTPACKPKGCRFNSQSRAHAWVAGQVPSRGCARGNHTLILLSLSFSLPSPLSKNKEIKAF